MATTILNTARVDVPHLEAGSSLRLRAVLAFDRAFADVSLARAGKQVSNAER